MAHGLKEVRAKKLHVPITFEVGEVQALPFPDGTFDVCRACRLLEHLPHAGLKLGQRAHS